LDAAADFTVKNYTNVRRALHFPAAEESFEVLARSNNPRGLHGSSFHFLTVLLMPTKVCSIRRLTRPAPASTIS